MDSMYIGLTQGSETADRKVDYYNNTASTHKTDDAETVKVRRSRLLPESPREVRRSLGAGRVSLWDLPMLL